jgi:hypothetical protein
VNERQRDLFLWLWAERRKPGQAAIAMRGALIGALGGIVFAWMLMPSSGSFMAQLERGGALLLLSIPAFAWIGFLGANRVWVAQEEMYQSMLAQGARVPDQKPVMQMRDRGPAIAVAIAVAVIVGFIIFVAVTLG